MSYPPALPTHSYNHMVMKMAMLKLGEEMCWFVSRKLNKRSPYFKYLPQNSAVSCERSPFKKIILKGPSMTTDPARL